MQALYALYRRYLAELGIVPYPAAEWQHEKIRVGYLSADLRDHAVGQFVRPFRSREEWQFNLSDFESNGGATVL